MHLTKIELQGFKSFAEKTTIEMKKGITSVVGPNGSGKSNICDAIRWVLGEQSLKTLRGTKPSDLVFAGTATRKSLGFAQVSLIFDNSDNVLPIEYSEVKISRRIYRTGESQVLINDNIARLKDVTELFLDTGIGKDGYSIIGQGRVEQIISSKSEDRRHIFEEAAGIVKYRYRKEESEKKLEKTKLNLLRINDIIDQIGQNLAPLLEQSNKAQKYLDLKKELRLKDTNLIKINLDKAKSELEIVKNELEDCKINIEDKKLEYSNNNIYLKDLKNELENLQNEIDSLSSKSFETKNEIEKINSEIKVVNSKKESFIQNIKDIKELILQLEQTIQKNKLDIEEKRKRQEQYLENDEKFKNLLEEKNNQYNKLYDELSTSKKEKNSIKDKIDILKEQNYENQIELSSVNLNIENINNILSQNSKHKIENINKLERIKINNEDNLKEFNNVSSKLKVIDNKIKENQEVIDEISDKLNLKKQENSKLSEKYNKLYGSYKVLEESEKENERLFRATKELISKSEVLGIVGKCFKVDDKYLNAIEICLGNKVQNIIVKDKNIAKNLINYLKDNKIGRATFLPIDDLKICPIDISNIKDEKGFISTADNLVECSQDLNKVAKYLLCQFVVVDNLENGLNISKKDPKLKIITLDGDFISPEGTLTGGFKQKNINSVLGRANRIESLKHEIDDLKQSISKIDEEIENINNKYVEQIEISKDLKKQRDEINEIYIEQKEQNKYIILEIEKLEQANQKLDKINSEKHLKLESEIQLKEKLENLKTKQIDEINELENKYNTIETDESDKKIELLKDEISDLKISIASIQDSKESINEIIDRINKENSSYNSKIQKYNFNIENLKSEIIKSDLEIEKYNSYIEEITIKSVKSINMIDELKQKKGLNNDKIKSLEQKILTINDDINILNQSDLKYQNKIFKINEQINYLMQKLWDEYELTPNNITEFIEIKNIANTQKEIIDLKDEIKSLGDINISAIEEYKEQNKKYEHLKTQKEDLEQTISKLKNLISAITQTMRIQFANQFKKINKNFQEVFSQLFGGGSAYLELEDQKDILECGIEIKAQPPGKKLQNMNLLSGGEKALTAISILFAILKINPSPFCVLDEIEAALDDVNVYRFSNFLNQFSQNTQFLLITHRKGTMEIANTIYGITMEEKGISKLLSLQLNK